MAEPKTKTEQRESALGRFFFTNGVNIVTLATVAFSAGIVVNRVDAMEKQLAILIPKVSTIEVHQARQDARYDRLDAEIRRVMNR